MIKENEENWEVKGKGLDEIESSWNEGWKIGDLEIWGDFRRNIERWMGESWNEG